MTVQPPVVAGSFYPADPGTLGSTVKGLLSSAPALDVPPPKAVVLPHAGYRFSGAVAASAAITLRPGIQRVVILGPSHRFAFKGVALPDANALATPLGELPLDRAACDALLAEPDVAVVPRAFAEEHSIEVELPFLIARLGEVALVPLVVGEISVDRLAALIGKLWGGEETLIVISTDLTHFLTAEQAAKIDLATAHKVEKTDGSRLSGRDACGHRPLSAFLKIAAEKGLRMTRTALTHSGAVTGDNTRVVGYGAWLAHEAEEARLSPAHRSAVLRVARQTLLSRARKGRPPEISLGSFPAPLQGIAPAFVTLTRKGRLRGCIGSLQPHQPLARDVLHNAVKAGFKDPRFTPITEAEIEGTDLEVAILSAPAPMLFSSQADLRAQIRPGRDGLIFESKGRRGTFLPKVWDHLATPDAFLDGLKVKAGLPKDHWAEDVQVWRYVTETFSDRSAEMR